MNATLHSIPQVVSMVKFQCIRHHLSLYLKVCGKMFDAPADNHWKILISQTNILADMAFFVCIHFMMWQGSSRFHYIFQHENHTFISHCTLLSYCSMPESAILSGILQCGNQRKWNIHTWPGWTRQHPSISSPMQLHIKPSGNNHPPWQVRAY